MPGIQGAPTKRDGISSAALIPYRSKIHTTQATMAYQCRPKPELHSKWRLRTHHSLRRRSITSDMALVMARDDPSSVQVDLQPYFLPLPAFHAAALLALRVLGLPFFLPEPPSLSPLWPCLLLA